MTDKMMALLFYSAFGLSFFVSVSLCDSCALIDFLSTCVFCCRGDQWVKNVYDEAMYSPGGALESMGLISWFNVDKVLEFSTAVPIYRYCFRHTVCIGSQLQPTTLPSLSLSLSLPLSLPAVVALVILVHKSLSLMMHLVVVRGRGER